MISSILSKVKQTFSRTGDTLAQVKVPPLADPESVESEITPKDLKDPKSFHDQEPTDAKKVELVLKRFRSAQSVRRIHEPGWFDSWQMFRGEHWYSWDATLGAYTDLRYGTAFGEDGEEEARRVYSTRNYMKFLVKRVQARALQCKPIVSTAPMTDGQRDRMAADEGRAVLSHCDRRFDRDAQLHEATEWVLVSGPILLKIWFDPTESADMPEFDEMGQIVGSTKAPVGEICEEIVPCFEWYADPKAKRWEDANYVIHARVVPLDYVQRKYSENGTKRGWAVNADAATDEGGIETRMALAVGDSLRYATQEKDSVLLVEMWEKPSGRYPRGRILVVANKVLLRDDPWPDFLAALRRFPFVPLAYNASVGTVYGQNLAKDLIDAQRSLNSYVSRLEERRNEASLAILAARGSRIGIDAYEGNRLKQVIYYSVMSEEGGAPLPPPEWQASPPFPPEFFQALQQEISMMQDMAGVRDGASDMPAGVTAAQAINLLQQADATQTAAFISNLIVYTKATAELEIAFAAAYYDEPRLIEIDDVSEPDPAAAKMKLQTFKALNAGGSCRVELVPGSGIAETNVAKQERLERWYAQGMLGQQGTPEAIEAFFELMGETISDKVMDLIRRSWQRMLAAQAQEQPKPDPTAIEMAQLAAKAQSDQANIAAKANADAQDRQHQAETLAIEHTQKMDEIQAQGKIDLAKAQMSVPGQETVPQVKIALSGTLGPQGTASAEENAGLEPDSPDELRQAAAAQLKAKASSGKPASS